MILYSKILRVLIAYLKSSGTPVHETNRFFRFDLGNSSVHFFGNSFASEEQTASHVLAGTRITFNLKYTSKLKVNYLIINNH